MRAEPASNPLDPLSGDDPFAVLDTHDSNSAVSTKPVRIKTEGSVYLKNVRDDSNQGASLLETRLTLSDMLDTSAHWRWLFKGFNSVSSERASDGNLRDAARVDELFVDWKSERGFASLGKRRVNWGHAQGFNPVNVTVPPRDPLDPSRETEGQPLLWINRADGAQAVDGVVTRNYDSEYVSDQTRWGLKWNFATGKSDYALYYFDGERYRDGRAYARMLGGSFSADVFPGMTLYAEAARFGANYRNYYDGFGMRMNKNDAYWQAVAGSGVSLGGKARVSVEYFRNEQGYSKTERVNYFGSIDMPLADDSMASNYLVTGMNRNYLLLSYQDEFRERYTLELSALIPDDKSYSLRAQGNYALSDHYELRVVWLRNDGARTSEFGNSPLANALEIGLNVGF